MLVMHFVRSSDTPQIPVIAIPEYFDALVDKYVMYYEIT